MDNTTATTARELRIVPGMKKGHYVVLQAASSDEGRAQALKFWPAWDGYQPIMFCSSRAGAERVIAERAA